MPILAAIVPFHAERCDTRAFVQFHHDDAYAKGGVPLNVREIATKGAENRGMTVGDWISEAVVAFSKADTNRVSADVPTVALVDDMAAVGTIGNKSCLNDFAEFCSALLQRSDSEKVTNLVSIAEHNVAEFFCDSFEVVTESVHQKHI